MWFKYNLVYSSSFSPNEVLDDPQLSICDSINYIHIVHNNGPGSNLDPDDILECCLANGSILLLNFGTPFGSRMMMHCFQDNFLTLQCLEVCLHKMENINLAKNVIIIIYLISPSHSCPGSMNPERSFFQFRITIFPNPFS